MANFQIKGKEVKNQKSGAGESASQSTCGEKRKEGKGNGHASEGDGDGTKIDQSEYLALLREMH